MITAILEDNKCFRASYSITRLYPKIEVPISPKLTEIIFGEYIPESPTIKKMSFKFYKWIEENKVALYREA